MISTLNSTILPLMFTIINLQDLIVDKIDIYSSTINQSHSKNSDHIPWEKNLARNQIICK